MEHFDYFVIGAGSGGVRSARIAAMHGAKVGIAEKSALGGTCVNIGCVPKKLFSYASDYGPALQDMKGFGWTDAKASFDWKTLLGNKNKEIERLNGVYNNILEKAGVQLFKGAAKFIDANTLDIDGTKITAKTILIATGGIPRKPDFPGSEHTIVSDDAFYLDDFPKKVVIQGGGYIAVEFAHIFHGLGAHVTILYRGKHWMNGFDSEITGFLKDEYIKQGIDIRFQTDIETIEKNDVGYVVNTNAKPPIICDLILSAIGRVPNTKGLNLSAAHIATKSNGQIEVDENLQSSAPNIYAVGDVCTSMQLTPVAIAQGHKLADTLYGKGAVRDVNLDLIPTAIFSSPPMGTVGFSEEDAKKAGYEIKIFKTSFKPMKHTLSGRDEKMMMKLIIDQKTERVIGCHMCGADAPEILQGIGIAMNAGATKSDFDRTLGIHPTSAEELVTMS